MAKVNQLKEFDEVDFFVANPQFGVARPFDEVRRRKDIDPSKTMWCVVLYCENDDESIFAHLPEDIRKEELTYWYEGMLWDDELIKEAITRYPFFAMTAAARSLKEEEDIIMRRTAFLREQYDEAITEKDINLAEKLEKMLKNNAALYENLEKAMDKFAVEKAKGSQLRGGRVESFSEKGII